ncbi:GNAT family N-acetyltransferase [Brevibacillus choshinensis]|uniref:GNAT family N-acetyltransferase n=1 Tax=Brevibacillus choshinensis TaxID=54911 RepID=A0ABX7FRY8_BRECH|nr:GNAT family N-acetyltransferase [Brevibacillus choshinensis]QRG69001.1 GNAT family N-acetyltransferase [Brevibacillus choshinensis]
MESISIVSYGPEWAQAVAEMWNASRDSWGGGNSITTAEQIRQEEASSDALAVYLAIAGDRVVGYCSLAEYREDTGALYIPLLNVRPEYHGKKVGRLLLARVLDETVKLGWPRLDLYTWAGNTKAVPLYKKFGFFWEDRDDSTHLMNMIPTVLRTEALAPYFEEIDWYQDSTREIVVEPDGRKDNGFDYFTYSWEKGEKRLRVEFERLGRGMRLIETEDYLLAAEAEKPQLVFGQQYQIHYRIINKTGKPLHLSMKGESNETIRFDYQQELEVTGETTLSATFFVDAIAEEQSVWRTHPRVSTHMRINGKTALFQVGILPKFPASLSLQVPGFTYPGQTTRFYLDVENSFAEEAEFSFELPSLPFLDIDVKRHTLRLQGKERLSLPLTGTLHEYGFYGGDVHVEAKLANGASVSFVKKIGTAFAGLGALLSGETEQSWQIHHGHHALYLSKDDNEMTVYSGAGGEPTHFTYPKLGKPYSSEFSKKRAEQVECIHEKGAIGLRVHYRSGAYPHLALIGNTLLLGDGTVEHGFVLENVSADKPAADIWISQGFAHPFHRPVLPYQGRYVETPSSYGSDLDYWDGELITENWLFARDETASWGMCWPPEYRIDFQGWYTSLETSIDLLEPRGKRTYGPIFLSHGGYADWREFRAFARKEALPEDLTLTSHLELLANEQNPFVGSEEISVVVNEHKQLYLDGELTASLASESGRGQTRRFAEADEKTEASFSFVTPDRAYEIVQVDGRFATHETQLRTVIFPLGSEAVLQEIVEESGKQILVADNGPVRIKAAPDFSPSLYSLTCNGQEWLASSFPEPKPKSWWNPWTGGIGNQVEELSAFSLLKEERSASFVQLTDNRQNAWQGIKLTYHVKKQEKLRGLTCHQYYLLLPGVPVLCHTSEIVQNTGTYFADTSWSTDIFLQTEDPQEHVWLKTVGADGEQLSYTLAQGELSIVESSDYIVGAASRKEQLQILTDLDTADLGVYANKEVAVASVVRNLHLPNNSATFTPPLFFLFADKTIPADALSALRAIRFVHEGRVPNENH